MTIEAGDDVSWSNTTGSTHNVCVAAAGSYKYVCEFHAQMTGTISVNPTQTEQTTVAADATAPVFAGKAKRRSSRRALIMEVQSSEEATLKAAVLRRPPRGRSFSRVSESSLAVKPGKNVVTLLRTSRGVLRSGAYRVKLQLVDAAGNKSATQTLNFKLA